MTDEAACDQPPIFFHQPSRDVSFLSVCIHLQYQQVPEALLHMHDYRLFTIDFSPSSQTVVASRFISPQLYSMNL